MQISENHLEEVEKNYFQHLFGAWKVASILIIHGLLPNVWKHKASDIICTQKR